MLAFVRTFSIEKLEELQKFGKLQKLQGPESMEAESMDSDSEYAPSVVRECCLPLSNQLTKRVNVSDREWRIRLATRWYGVTEVESRFWCQILIALVLKANGIYIELWHQHRFWMWPKPGNRDVCKRKWETQVSAVRVCLRGASVYFTFWRSWVKGLVKGDRTIEQLLSLSSRTSSDQLINVTGCAANGIVGCAEEDEEGDEQEEEEVEEEEEEEEKSLE